MKSKILILFIVIMTYGTLSSKPEYTILTGNRCISCHVNTQGSGVRNSLGSYSRNQTSLFHLDDTALGNFFKSAGEYSSFMDDRIIAGFDFRLQSAKTGESEREIFAMQMSPYIAYAPFDWLTLQGHVNLAEAEYAGQQVFTASVTIKPSIELPELKMGFIKPSIGSLYDDHTLLIRQIANQYYSSPIIPPDYAEAGAELSYDYFKWLNLTAGLYKSSSMNEIQLFNKQGIYTPIVNKNDLFKLVRVAFMPRFFDNAVNTNFGGTHYFNGDFSISDIFLHLGWTDYFSLAAEYVITAKKSLRETNNYLVELMYQIMPALMAYVRYEGAETKDMSTPGQTANYRANQYVIGLNIYPLPFIELRPEYRIIDRHNELPQYSDWAAQLHIYY